MSHPEPSIQDDALRECASEPIHLLGRTQRFGVLLGLDGDRRVAAVSGNSADWCGLPPEALLGQPAQTVLPAASVAAACAHGQVAAATGHVQHLHHLAWPGRAGVIDLSVHATGGLVVLEAEPAIPAPDGSVPSVEESTRELAALHRVDELARSAATAVARITGYDRVMVYRFAADGSGTVIAEHLAPDQVSYLGLRYPAGDIPPQARALYLRNTIRLIADAGDAGLPLHTVGGAAVDLSHAVLRSVSAVHLEYLRNMGTAASMSISLVIDGQLWGLIACHHRRPLRPSLACRAMAALLGRLYSMALARAEREPLARDIRQLLFTHPGVDPLVDGAAHAADRDRACAALAGMMGLTGVAAQVEGRLRTWGQTPDAAGTAEILAALPAAGDGGVVAVESLGTVDPALARLSPGVCGLLALPLSALGGDWVLLLRDEVVRHVRWAGQPDKAVQRAPDGRLSPRHSFEEWQASVRGHCEAWTVAELELARVLRTRLLEVLAARREQHAVESTRQAARQQALLVRELNHRVRNMLGLIKGLVQQTARSASSVEDLTTRLHDRVHALSRAYTQIEKAQWQPTSLATLLHEEAGAFGEPGQLEVDGPQVLLEPQAFLSFAMVLHELATNARKYGALSVPQGRVAVSWQLSHGGALEIDWQERGGPAVTPPRREGFGSRLIRQGLQHQLHGHATLDYEETGLHARLWTPRGFVPVAPEPAPRRAAAPQEGAASAPPSQGQVPAVALVVEDDLVVALLAETMLQQMGCTRVLVAGTADDALGLLRTQAVGIALIDVNLGDHSSERVALRLAELGVPTVVTTGYSDTDSVPQPLRGLRRLGKPYTQAELARAVSEVTSG